MLVLPESAIKLSASSSLDRAHMVVDDYLSRMQSLPQRWVALQGSLPINVRFLVKVSPVRKSAIGCIVSVKSGIEDDVAG
jgi:hypothetical protein